MLLTGRTEWEDVYNASELYSLFQVEWWGFTAEYAISRFETNTRFIQWADPEVLFTAE